MWNVLGCKCSEKWADVAPLVLRVALGAVFFYHGYDKVFNMGVANVAGFLGQMGFPFASVFGFILAYGELIAGALLILGFLTHWAAKFAVIVGIVAWVLVHLANGFSAQNGGYEFIMLITAAAVSVLITGAGKYSIDARWMNREEPII